MRSVTFLVAGLFSIYSIQPPQARASQAKPATLNEALEQTLSVVADAKLELVDAEGKALDAKSFQHGASKEFSLTAEEDGHHLKFTAKRSDLKSGPAYTLVVSDLETNKVISRRKFIANTSDADVEAVKLRFKQTARSLSNDIARHLGEKETSHTTIQKIKYALVGLLGIPSARAGVSNDFFIGVGILMGLISLIAMGMMLAWAAKPEFAESQSTLVKGAVAVGSLTVGGYLTAFILSYCTDELQSLIRAFKSK